MIDALIFDFDDTLVATYELFMEHYDAFVAAMAALGFRDRQQVRATLHRLDIAVCERCGGPVIGSFPQAIRETYWECARRYALPFDEATAKELEQIGWQVHERPARLYPESEPLLRQLQGKARLFLLSQGDEQAQQRRMRQSGLLPYFTAVRIVPVKDEAAYRALIADYAIDPARSWMIGNSMRSDVNPALAAGLQAAHLLRDDWAYDQAPPAGDYLELSQLSDIMRVMICE